jgi:signal transduction histidine kinase
LLVALRPSFVNTRNALLLGFGGLLALLVFSGIDAVQVLSQMRTGNSAIRREFLERARRIDEIRSSLYLSGTLVRDYLLEPDPHDAERQRAGLREVRARMDQEMRDYANLLRNAEMGPVNELHTRLDAYWQSLDPVLQWTPEQRRSDGLSFLRNEVFPRRTAMLDLADRIGAVNASELVAGDRRLADLFAGFRNRLLLMLALTVGLGVMLTAATVRQILRLEKQTEYHLDAVTAARAELRELSARLVEAQERERKSISRELHDAVGQSLSAALLELRNMKAVLPPESDAQANAENARRLVETSVGMIRNMALLLRPSMLDDLGLLPAVEWHAREVWKRSGLMVNVAASGMTEDLPDAHKTCIYRVVQEALHNVVQHAHATNVRVIIERDAAAVRVSIQDDGQGFDPSRQTGLGLIGLQERVKNLGGAVVVRSEPGRGTMLDVSLPSPPDGASEVGAG